MAASRVVVRLALIILVAHALWGVALGQVPAVPADSPSRVAGMVVDLAGQPVPGAEVFAAFDPAGDGDEESPADRQPVRHDATDAAGRFDFPWPERSTGRGSPTLWVVHPGHRLARGRVPDHPTSPIPRVVLEPVVASASASIELLGPGGTPVEGARIIPTHWFEGNIAATSARVWEVPRAVGDRIAGSTDHDGRATLPGVAALRLSAVIVESRLGTQVASWDESLVARHRVIKLEPVGRVVGRVDGRARAGLAVQITTRAGGKVVGRTTVTTDAAGHYEAARVAAGAVEVRVIPQSEGDELPAAVTPRTLAPGAAATIDIALRRGVAIRGLVRERGAGGPVAGAWVAVLGTDEATVRRVRTDTAGRFSAVTLPGGVTVRVESAPPDFLLPHPAGRGSRADVLVGEAGHDWPPIELDRGRVVQGRVLDDSGRPAEAGVLVDARWSLREGRVHDDYGVSTTTGADGRFEVGPVAPGVALAFSAHRPGDRVAHENLPAAVLAGPVEIRLRRADPMATPSGRVVDATGRPVAHALVQFRVADPGLTIRGPRSGRRIATAGLDAVVTDEQGRYVATGRVDARHRYLASAEAVGCESGRTPVVVPHAAPDASLNFPDLVVDRHPETTPVVVGRVVGVDGKPIAGAVVHDLARHQTVTNQDGWFQLEKVGSVGPAFLFARHPGYRFQGRTLDPWQGEADRPITLTLIRHDEPATDRSMIARDGRFAPRSLVRLLIQSLIVEPSVGRILALKDPAATANLLEHLARIDPTRVVAWVGAGVVADTRVADGLRRIAARQAALGGFDRAAAIVGPIEDPATRCRAMLEVIDLADTLDPGRKRAAVERVERDARSLEDLERRVIVLGRVAESWINIDKREQARRVIDEASTIAATLPRATLGARAWCALIEPLAQIDPALARVWLHHLTDPTDLDRCRLTIALGSARLHPVEALDTFRQIRDARTRLQATPELCYRLATVDRALAVGLVDAIRPAHPFEAAHALGMIAAGLVATDRVAAAKLLTEAFDHLEAAAGINPAGRAEAGVEPAAIAASLLPVVEAVDSSLVPEFFWRTVALHPPAGRPNLRGDALLALLLDRYNPTAALGVFDPNRTRRAAISPVDLPALVLAATQLAPEVACRWVELPPGTIDPLESPGSPTDLPHLALIAAWNESDQGRRDQATRQYLHLWTPDLPPIPR